MRGRLHQKLNNKNGFTLAETLVALAISIILLAITMVGILQYYKNMKLTEMDSTAKEIFIAAQNHLTAADASGELKRYREKALDETDVSVKEEALGTLMSEPSDVPNGIEWPSTNKDYYYIKYNVKDGTVGNLEGSILQYMLPFGAIDETVRADGNYIIEYNVRTATVYGVFYAENDVSFSYVDITALDKQGGRADTSDGRHTRRDYDAGIIGYYGGAMAGDLLSGETADLNMKIENKDTLKITVIDPNYYNKTTDNEGTLQTHLTLIVKGKESGNEEKFTLDLSDSDNPTVAPEKKEAKKNLWWDVKNVELKDAASGKTKTGLEYTITLDDITRPGGHFADICPTLMPGEDIVVKVVSSSTTALATVREAEGMTNSLFESVKKDADAEKENKKQAIASIGYLRHLENLDPGVSKLPQDTNAVKDGTKVLYKPEYLVKRAAQTRDMDYNEFFGKEKDNRKSIYQTGLKEDAVNAEKLADGSYYGIRNDLLLEYDGANHDISNVYIKNTRTNEAKTGDINGGIFRYIYLGQHNFTAKDLILKDFDVTATKNSAAFAAEMNWTGGSSANTCKITNILVDGGSISSSHAQGNSGGLIGYTGVKTTVSNCAAVVKSVATGARIPPKEGYKYAGDAGGLIGEINSTGSLVENCYSGGLTKDGKYEHEDPEDYNIRGVDMAGGLIGKLNGFKNTIKNSYSTCSVYAANSGVDGASYAGGLIGGELESSNKGNHSYKNCYAAGYVGGGKDTKWGAFIGKPVSPNDNYQDCQFLQGISPVSVRAAGERNLDEQIKETPMNKLKSDEPKTTHAKDPTLEDKTYPFRVVNKTGLSSTDYVYSEGIHYGDWQEPEEVVSGNLMLAYRETVKNKDYWYIVKAEKTAEGIEYETVVDTLPKQRDIYIEDKSYSYGYLCDSEISINQLFVDEEKLKEYIGGSDGEKVDKIDKLEGTYKFYEVTSYPHRDDEGIVKTPAAKDETSFSFNPDFAAAIGGKQNLGTKKAKYQVRTNVQLRNIASNKYENEYNKCHFSQTADIDLGGTDFSSFGGSSFTGTYDAFYKGGKGYQIKGFYQSRVSGSSKPVGLITKIGSGAEVSYVNLSGEISLKEANTNMVGSLSGQLLGVIANCNAEVALEFQSTRVLKSKDIGGLIGDAAAGSKITNCQYNSGENQFSVEDSTQDPLHIGGLVGDNSGEIVDSSANVKLNLIHFSGDTEKCIGGLVGLLDTFGTVRDSTSEGSINGTVNNNCLLGGFAGKIDVMEKQEVAINDCHSNMTIRKTLSSYTNGIKIGGFVGKLTNGIVEKCSSQSVVTSSGYENHLGGFAGQIKAGIVNQCWSRFSWSSTNSIYTGSLNYIGGFAGHVDGATIKDSYAVTTEGGTTTGNGYALFIGQSENDKSDLKQCHGLELENGLPKVSSWRFVNKSSSESSYDGCYMLSSLSDGGVTSIDDSSKYQNVSTFAGWDFDGIWEMTNNMYPTLRSYPEPVMSINRMKAKLESTLEVPASIE